MHKNKDYKIVILLFTLFILFLTLNNLSPSLFWDENAYLGNARSHISQSRFTEDYRFPLLEYILALAWKLTGESIFIARLIMILFTLATIYLFYLITKHHLNNYHLIFTLLFSLSPLFLKWGFRIYTDIPTIFFILLSYYLILKKNIFLAGIFSATAFLSRFPSALFPLAIGIYLLYTKKPKDLLLFSTGFAIALFPWFLYNQLTYSNPIWDLQNQYNIIGTYTSSEPLSKHLTNIGNTLGLFAILSLLGILTTLKNKKYFIPNLYILLSIIYYSSFVNLKLERYFIMILPFIYLTAFTGFETITKNIKPKKIITLLLLLITIYLAIFSAKSINTNCSRNTSITQSVNYMDSKNLSTEIIITNIFPYIGYHNNLESYHLWTENIQALLIRYHPSYFIHSNHDGTYFNRTILDKERYLRLEQRFKDNCNAEVSIYKVV
tara:strand:- start:7361 stop:8671 length:1311 start_codon:yes stop_codon:yes gene_type:complete